MHSRTVLRSGEQPIARSPNSTMHGLIYAFVNSVLWGTILWFTWPLLQR